MVYHQLFMKFFKKYIGDLFLNQRFYWVLIGCILFFVTSFFIPSLGNIPSLVVEVFVILILADYFFLFIINRKPSGRRIIADRLSNGDENKIVIVIRNEFPF